MGHLSDRCPGRRRRRPARDSCHGPLRIWAPRADGLRLLEPRPPWIRLVDGLPLRPCEQLRTPIRGGTDVAVAQYPMRRMLFSRFVWLSLSCIGALALAMGFVLSSLLTRAASEWEWENTAALVRREVR